MTREELEALIDGGNIEACVAAFEGMPEASRLKLGSAAVARLRALGKGIPGRMASFTDTNPDPRIMAMLSMDPPLPARYRTARAAVLATASFSQWKIVRAHGLPSNEMALRIFLGRRPPWLGEMVELICEMEDEILPRWPLIRGMVQEGLCGPPKSGRYIDRMLMTLPGEALRARIGLKDFLRRDPGLLEHEDLAHLRDRTRAAGRTAHFVDQSEHRARDNMGGFPRRAGKGRDDIPRAAPRRLSRRSLARPAQCAVEILRRHPRSARANSRRAGRPQRRATLTSWAAAILRPSPSRSRC